MSHLCNWMNYLFVLQGQKDKNTGLDLKLVVVSVKLFIALVDLVYWECWTSGFLTGPPACPLCPLAGQGRQMRLLDWLDAGEEVEPEHLGVLSQLKMLLSWATRDLARHGKGCHSEMLYGESPQRPLPRFLFSLSVLVMSMTTIKMLPGQNNKEDFLINKLEIAVLVLFCFFVPVLICIVSVLETSVP